MLDGAARVDELVAAAAADGQPALACTDHGNMYGAIDFYKACQKHGVKPIIGTEAYMAEDSRFERPTRTKATGSDDFGGETSEGKKLYYHLTLLAENNVGYKNMIQLASRAYLEGYYMKPRVDWDVLSDHSEGVIATSGCLGGQVLQALIRNDYHKAKNLAGRLQDIYGKENFFIEIQDHGIADQKRTMGDLFRISKELAAPLVCTNDSHYVHQHDAVAHDALLCVQVRSTLADPNRFRFESDQHYLKTAAEMRALFPEAACDNTLWIAERAQVNLDFDQHHLPQFPVPEGYANDDAYLTELVFKGAEERWPNMTDDVVARLAFELRTIKDMGFSSYFLIMWDIVRHANEVGIRTGAGRGSAAGCAVSYCLGITQVDPLKYDLLFERFLNPSRVSMPDIDLDMTAAGRDEMIRYAAKTYGEDRVAQIVTFSTIKARAAVRDAARVLGQPFTLGDKIAKAMPEPVMGRDAPLKACFEKVDDWEFAYEKGEELRSLYNENPDAREVVDVARGLEGLRRQDSIHAAAVVISDVPLQEIVPLQRKGEDAPTIIQYDMHGVEALGLLKMDFLGLRNLDVITECERLIFESTGVQVDVTSLTYDDPATFRLLQRGDTVGVFQLESRPMRELVVRLRPETFDHVAALLALYRPGPMAANMHNDYADRKNGLQPLTVLHEDARDLLDETYGLMIYQEQVMGVAQLFAGYTLAEADLLRKAIGKKNKELLAAEQDKFVRGCVDKGYREDFADDLFQTIMRFADYCFNKSHAYGYGVTAYQTAWLKANYPTQYMAALCTGAPDLQKASIFLADARKMGIPINLPSVNKSQVNFSASATEITVGLAAISQVGAKFSREVVEEREQRGPYTDLYDFVLRTPSLNKRTFVALAEAGAFDEFGEPRLGLIGVADEILKAAKKDRNKQSAGQVSLFGDDPAAARKFEIPQVEYPPSQRLDLEKKVMGVYVSGHPMDGLDDWIADGNGSVADLLDCPDETIYKVPGLVSGVELKRTRMGDEMSHFMLEDQETAVRVTAFPKNWAKVRETLTDGTLAIVTVRATTDNRGERDVVLINAEVRQPEEDQQLNTDELRLFIPQGFYDAPRALGKLKGLLLSHRGSSPVALYVSRSSFMALPKEYAVEVSEEFLAKVKALFASFRSLDD